MRISRIVVLAAVAAGVMAVPASPAPSHLTKVKPFTVTHGPVSLARGRRAHVLEDRHPAAARQSRRSR